MADATPIPCTPQNCGDLFSRCGKTYVYSKHGCRCDRCRQANRDASRKFRVNNPDRARANTQRYKSNNRDKVRAASRDYARRRYVENPEAVLSASRKWRKNNPDKMQQCSARWKAANPNHKRVSESRRRALRKAATAARITSEQLDDRMSYFGWRCYLQLDGCTVTGDTVDHVKPLNKGGAHMLSNMRPACRSCNSSKNDKWPFPAVTSRVGC